MDINTMAVGHAIVLRITSNLDDPREFGNKLVVSPKTLSISPEASRSQGDLFRRDMTANPPTTIPRSSTSPIGYARFVSVVAVLPPVDVTTRWNTNAAHSAAAPNAAIPPSSQLARLTCRVSDRMNSITAMYVTG